MPIPHKTAVRPAATPDEAVAASPMTTAEATIGALIAHGIDTLYALPGVHNDHLFDALFKASDRIRVVHTRHEQGAAYMALGAALATGKPQAYAVVPGPGLLNTGAALLTAYSMNAPVLALIGQIPDAAIGRGLGHLHEIRDQAGIIYRDWSISPHGSASRQTRRASWPRLSAPWRAAGAGRRRWNAPSTSGAAARRSPRSPRRLPVHEPPIDEDAVAGRRQASRRGKKSDDRLRRRRAGCLRRSDARCPPCCRRRCSAIAAAAAFSTAATRLSITLPLAHAMWREADVVIGIGTRMLTQLTHLGHRSTISRSSASTPIPRSPRAIANRTRR